MSPLEGVNHHPCVTSENLYRNPEVSKRQSASLATDPLPYICTIDRLVLLDKYFLKFLCFLCRPGHSDASPKDFLLLFREFSLGTRLGVLHLMVLERLTKYVASLDTHDIAYQLEVDHAELPVVLHSITKLVLADSVSQFVKTDHFIGVVVRHLDTLVYICLLYTSPSPRD